MTLAICLNCGATKFGAFCPCSYCNHMDSEENELSLILTDWCIHNEEDFDIIGNMIREIRKHSNNPEIRYFVLIQYLFNEFPDLVSGELPKNSQEIVKNILSRCVIPPPQTEVFEINDIEIQEYFKKSRDELRQNYLNLPPYKYRVANSDECLFTKKEKENIVKYGNWFKAIEKGEIPLTTERLKHFFKSQKNIFNGERTKWESLWYRYKQVEIFF